MAPGSRIRAGVGAIALGAMLLTGQVPGAAAASPRATTFALAVPGRQVGDGIRLMGGWPPMAVWRRSVL